MKKTWKSNLVLYSLLCLIIVLSCVLFIFLNYKFEKQSLKINDVIGFSVDSNHNSEIIKCWYDEDESVYYVFLPTDAEMVTVTASKGFTATIDGFMNTEKIKIAELEMNEPYNCELLKDGKVYSNGTLMFMQSQNIPALFITTESGTMQYINAQKGNAESGSYSIWASDQSQEFSGMLSEICGRGNTSWTDCEKKGYKLVLEQPKSLIGLYESDAYVLIANARSNYLSNTIAFWLEEQIGIKNVTQSEPVDLYFNGEYAGSYILCERIHVGENSIDITDLDELNGQINTGQNVKELEQYVSKDGNLKSVLWNYEPSDISGGYLIERDVPEYYADEKSGFIISSGDHYVIKSPKYASKNEAEYIQEYVQEVYDAISDLKGYNPNTGIYYGEYIDMESFVLKYVLEEFLAFNDAGRSSAYYYKEQNDVLYAGPGWDFEGAFLGNSQYLTHLNGTEYSTDLYEKLWQHEDFRILVKETYNDKLKPTIGLLLDSEFGKMQDEIAASVAMDVIRWNREDFLLDCDKIKEWIIARCEFLDEHWNEKQTYFTVKIKSDWENNAYIYLNAGEKLNSDELPQYIRDGYKFGGWMDQESGELFDFDQEINSDMTLKALWIPVNRSFIQIILQKAQQMVPEICFMLLFIVVGMIFLIKMKKVGGKRR